MSVTIEGIFVEIKKTFIDDPLKKPFKSPVIIEKVKFILIFLIKGPSKIVKNSHYYWGNINKLKKFQVSPRHFGFQMSVTIRRSNYELFRKELITFI